MSRPPSRGCRRLYAAAIAFLLVITASCADETTAPASTQVAGAPGSPEPPAGPASDPGTGNATTPVITLSSAEICFTPTLYGPDPRPDDVRITSTDGTAIDGLAAAVAYDEGQPAGWLMTAFDTTSAPARLWLTAQPGVIIGRKGLAAAPGTYRATVTVSSTTPGVAPATFRVTLEIRPLVSATLRITLSTVGQGPAGNGRLTGQGIDCVLTNGVQSGDCEETYAPETLVHVTAQAGNGQQYYNESCWAPGPCTDTGFDIAMSQDLIVTGGFGGKASKLVVHIQWEGAQHDGLAFVEGRHGLFCGHPGGLCSAAIEGGVETYELVAYGEYGAGFVRWEGACTGTSGVCQVRFDTPGTELATTAVFRTRPSSIGLRLVGDAASGSVSVSAPATAVPGGGPLQCQLADGVSGPCEGVLEAGVGTITLTAVPAPGSVFTGWEVGYAYSGQPPGTTCQDSAPVCVLDVRVGGSFINGLAKFARGP